jgi:uncharacterized protein
MQAQERELITGLFGRLQPFEAQARDGEADALIRDLAARQPAAPYLLVQTVLVQEQALKAAQARIAELEARAGVAAPAAPGFLGSAPRIGPWGASPAAPAAAPQPIPPTQSPLQAALAPQPAGGGFLRTALTTAAGVAGGALLFEGIRGLMGSNPGPFGSAAALQPSPLLPPDSLPAASSQDFAQDQAVSDDNASAADNQVDDYDTASLDQDTGGSDDDSFA